MAIQVRVKMLRDIGGFARGAFRTLGVADAERLAARGSVEIVGKPAHEKPRAAPKKRGAKPAAKRAAPPANKKAAPPTNKAG